MVLGVRCYKHAAPLALGIGVERFCREVPFVVRGMGGDGLLNRRSGCRNLMSG